MHGPDALVAWIRSHLPPDAPPLTPMKLQKLAHYAYGYTLGAGLDEALGPGLAFEAWEHGPVCRPIWSTFRAYGALPIPAVPVEEAPAYPAPVAALLGDVIDIYGQLTAWELREQSHRERPWMEAKGGLIAPSAIREHFAQRLKGRFQLPSALTLAGSSSLDRIPTRGYANLAEAAAAVRKVAAETD